MERWVRKRFIRDFLRLPEQKQREVLELMREFERAREMNMQKDKNYPGLQRRNGSYPCDSASSAEGNTI